LLGSDLFSSALGQRETQFVEANAQILAQAHQQGNCAFAGTTTPPFFLDECAQRVRPLPTAAPSHNANAVDGALHFGERDQMVHIAHAARINWYAWNIRARRKYPHTRACSVAKETGDGASALLFWSSATALSK
jgi:hypothetical protein